MFLLMQKGGSLGGKNLLPLLLSGGLGGGKKGGLNPFLLTSLLGHEKCEEVHKGGCTQPTTANLNANELCGGDERIKASLLATT